jgi:hypothetical protein
MAWGATVGPAQQLRFPTHAAAQNGGKPEQAEYHLFCLHGKGKVDFN